MVAGLFVLEIRTYNPFSVTEIGMYFSDGFAKSEMPFDKILHILSAVDCGCRFSVP